MPRLLTIGIPTYNRSLSLQTMLECLTSEIMSFEKDLEIIISDNCSTDETPEVITNWANIQCTDLIVKRVRHSDNIGVSRNLVSLLYAAKSDYFLFLGDDDKVNGENFSKILKLLAENRPSAVIQASWGGHIRGGKAGVIEFDDALALFYEYGNAWAGIVDRVAAIQEIESRSIRSEIESIVWPQTVFGFLAMNSLKERKIFATDFPIGQAMGEWQNITNKTYWVTSLYGLLKAASMIDAAIGGASTKKTFVALNTQGFMLHVRAIVWTGFITENSSSKSIRTILAKDYGVYGKLWAMIFYLAEKHPKFTANISALGYSMKTHHSPSYFHKKINFARIEYSEQVAQAKKNKKRFGDWF